MRLLILSSRPFQADLKSGSTIGSDLIHEATSRIRIQHKKPIVTARMTIGLAFHFSFLI